MFVLEHYQWVFQQVRRVAEVFFARFILANHPTHVREPEATLGRVGVVLGVVHMAVVRAVARSPNQNAVLHGHGAKEHQHEAHGPVGFVGAVCPKAVVTGGNRNAIQNGQHHK